MSSEVRTALTQSLAGTWWGPVPLGPGDHYGIRVTGPDNAVQKLLVDPWARALDGPIDWRSDPAALRFASERDSAPFVPRAVVVDEAFNHGNVQRPHTNWTDTVLYEVHVKGATMQHPDVPPHLRGTYAGLAHPAFVQHLKHLGVTAVELLPIHHSIPEERLANLGLTNYWGYNTLGYFAPDQRFGTSRTSQRVLGDPLDPAARASHVNECKAMIRTLHEAGIEVILDVVYNHTCEAGSDGPSLSWRGLDSTGWYRSFDVTGCGNTVDATQPHALRMILDSLRYWVEEFRVDGFRFDLAPATARDQAGNFDQRSAFLLAVNADPVLADVKLIAEPWDVGAGGYQVGNFPAPWAEWNDQYRDLVRDHWRGNAPLGAFGRRLTGGPDLFQGSGRRPWSSINFLSAHDGFTLRDLVSYNDKHNDANGESNRDGTSDNRSSNHGVEGPTDDPAVLVVRTRTVRALMATLLLSQGTPMILGGDEFGRSQYGNNNAYCQDNPISWFDWSSADRSMIDFTTSLLALRREYAAFRRDTWLSAGDAQWFAPDGSLMEGARWDDPSACGLMTILRGVGEEPDVLLLLNDAAVRQTFRLPEGCWTLTLSSDPAVPASAAGAASVPEFGSEVVDVAERTVAVYVATTT